MTTDASRTAAIEFDGATLRLGSLDVLRRVSFHVASGETTVILGRSGAGKSSALRLVNRLLEPTAGAVRVGGRPTTEWDPIALRRRTGYVIQRIGLFPHRTVAANVALVPRLLGWERERIEHRTAELLELVGLPPTEYAGRSRAVNSSESAWHAHWPPTHPSSWRTSRSAPWIRSRGASCRWSFAASPPSSGRPCCS